MGFFEQTVRPETTRDRKDWYPEIQPHSSFRLKVSGLHELYVEECGNPSGQPVVFLHGGPGAGLSPTHRRFFDPSHYRIILFDQRGAGKSRPFAELRENTTWDLVQDIEKIRTHLGIERWQVFGGSWGSTLALAYAQTHPGRVTHLVLRGIFLCRKAEIEWFYQSGAHWIFPDQWQRYIAPIPPSERDRLVDAFYRRLTSEDSRVRAEAAKAWSGWEGSTLHLIPEEAAFQAFTGDDMSQSLARIECHYFKNGCWFRTDNQLIEDVPKIRRIPTAIVHGRYDVVCPVKNAFDLSAAWPEARVEIIGDAGHAASEIGIRKALVAATDRFRTDIKGS
jgi:proline iminopeptidase